MAIKRPKKPPLEQQAPAAAPVQQAAPTVQQQVVVDPATGTPVVVETAPTESLRPVARPEDAPIDNPLPETPVIPDDPAVPQLQTPPIMRPGDSTDPANVPIDDPMAASVAAPLATAAAAAGAVAITEGMRRRFSRTGTTGDPAADAQLRGEAPAAIDNISPGGTSDGSTTSRPDQSADTTSGGSDQPAARATDAPQVQQPTQPDAGAAASDPATAPIDTTDVIPDAPNGDIDLSTLPEGTRVTDVNPTREGRFIAAGPASHVPQGAMINTQTKEMVVPTGDGRFIVVPPGYSNEAARYKMLQSVRSVLR